MRAKNGINWPKTTIIVGGVGTGWGWIRGVGWWTFVGTDVVELVLACDVESNTDFHKRSRFSGGFPFQGTYFHLVR